MIAAFYCMGCQTTHILTDLTAEELEGPETEHERTFGSCTFSLGPALTNGAPEVRYNDKCVHPLKGRVTPLEGWQVVGG